MAELNLQLTQIREIRFDGETSGERHDSAKTLHPEQVSRTERRRLADGSPTRQLRINANALVPDNVRKIVHIPKKHEIRDAPLRLYHEYMSWEQAGDAMIAYDDAHNLYAIKTIKGNQIAKGTKVQTFTNKETVVGMVDLYRDDEEIHMVYELMDVCLGHLLATPRGCLKVLEIAAICKEVGRIQRLGDFSLTYARSSMESLTYMTCWVAVTGTYAVLRYYWTEQVM